MSIQHIHQDHKYWPFRSLKDKKEDEAVHLPNPVVDGKFYLLYLLIPVSTATAYMQIVIALHINLETYQECPCWRIYIGSLAGSSMYMHTRLSYS